MAKYVMYDSTELSSTLLLYGVPVASVREIIRLGGNHEADNDAMIPLWTNISLSGTPIELQRSGNRHTLYIGTKLTATQYPVDVKIPPRNSLRTLLKKMKKYFNGLLKGM